MSFIVNEKAKQMKTCNLCETPIESKKGKIFCSPYCRSLSHKLAQGSLDICEVKRRLEKRKETLGSYSKLKGVQQLADEYY